MRWVGDPLLVRWVDNFCWNKHDRADIENQDNDCGQHNSNEEKKTSHSPTHVFYDEYYALISTSKLYLRERERDVVVAYIGIYMDRL